MEVDTAKQQPYDPLTALTRYLTQRNKPTAQEQKEKLTPEGAMPSVPGSTQHPLYNREIQSPPKRTSMELQRNSSGTYHTPAGT
jgi:hypothetical protein